MDFSESPKTAELRPKLEAFLREHVVPAEKRYFEEFSASTLPQHIPDAMEGLKAEARRQGLWNLHMPDPAVGPGLSTLEYAPLAELSGWSILAPEALNTAAPDSGNMEVLHRFGTPEQKERWLRPLLDGEIRSCIAMTEPDTSSSDPTNISTWIRREGDEYVISGRKWWISGAAHPQAKVLLLIGISNREADPHLRHTMVLVPMDSTGLTVQRQLPVFGYDDPGGHCELVLDHVRVPVENRIGVEGGAFLIAQSRLAAGRLHHCLRAVGMAERALALMAERSKLRSTFGRKLSEHGMAREAIALSRVEIEEARLLCLRASWEADRDDRSVAARRLVTSAKIAVPRIACAVIDRAIQMHGAGGLSADTPLAQMYAWARALRIVDGPDEVHLDSLARLELRHGPAPARGSAS